MGRKNSLVLFGIFLFFIFGFLFWVSAIGSSNYNITNPTLSDGAGNMSSSNYALDVVLGEISGNMSSSSYKNELGFWYSIDAGIPVVTLFSPLNNSGDNDGNLTFNYSVSEVGGGIISSCSLIFGWGINQTNSSISESSAQNFTLLNLAVGRYNWSVNCTDGSGNVGASRNWEFSVVKSVEFGGSTTDLSKVNVSNISNFVIDAPEYGKINFSEIVDLSNGSDIDSYVNVSFNRIELNSSNLTFLNKSAKLRIYNLTFSDPRILKDGGVCSSTICTKESYSGGALVFNVTGFSIYSSEETPVSSSSTTASSSGGGGLSSVGVEEVKEELEINPESFNLPATVGIIGDGKIRLENVGNKNLSVKLKSLNLEEIVKFSGNDFRLLTREIKLVDFDIVPPEKPGIYTGKIIVDIGSKKIEIPFALNVQSEKSLFDVSVEIADEFKRIGVGGVLPIEVFLLQAGLQEKMDVTLHYLIKDFDGKTHFQESETIAVFKQETHKKEFLLRDLGKGNYVVGVEVIYPGGIATASSQFKIGEDVIDTSKSKFGIIEWIVIVSVILVFVGLVIILIKYRRAKL